jgi:hypothetical protein
MEKLYSKKRKLCVCGESKSGTNAGAIAVIVVNNVAGDSNVRS